MKFTTIFRAAKIHDKLTVLTNSITMPQAEGLPTVAMPAAVLANIAVQGG